MTSHRYVFDTAAPVMGDAVISQEYLPSATRGRYASARILASQLHTQSLLTCCDTMASYRLKMLYATTATARENRATLRYRSLSCWKAVFDVQFYFKFCTHVRLLVMATEAPGKFCQGDVGRSCHKDSEPHEVYRAKRISFPAEFRSRHKLPILMATCLSAKSLSGTVGYKFWEYKGGQRPGFRVIFENLAISWDSLVASKTNLLASLLDLLTLISATSYSNKSI